MPDQQVDLAIVGTGRDGRRHRLAGRRCAGCRSPALMRSSPPHAQRLHPRPQPHHPRSLLRTSAVRPAGAARLCALGRARGERRDAAVPGLRRADDRPPGSASSSTARFARPPNTGCPCRPGRPTRSGTRVPALAPDHDMVGVFEPRAGVLAPERAVGAMLDQARRAGAHLLLSEPVRDWTSEADHVDVRSASRHVRARRLVLAAGPWLASLLGDLAPAPHRRARRAVPGIPLPATTAFRRRRSPSSCSKRRTAGCCTGCRIRAAASSWPSTTAARRRRPMRSTGRCRPPSSDAFHAFASRWVRDLPAGPADASVCLYTNTPDSDFLLDWHPGGTRRLRLQRLLGPRLQVRAGHRRGGGLGRRHAARRRTIWRRSGSHAST